MAPDDLTPQISQPHLIAIVTDNHLRRRWEAAFKLESFGKATLPHALPLLQHEQSGVLAAAIWLIGRTGNASHIGLLETHLADDRSAMPGMPTTRSVSDVAAEAIAALEMGSSEI